MKVTTSTSDKPGGKSQGKTPFPASGRGKKSCKQSFSKQPRLRTWTQVSDYPRVPALGFILGCQQWHQLQLSSYPAVLMADRVMIQSGKHVACNTSGQMSQTCDSFNAQGQYLLQTSLSFPSHFTPLSPILPNSNQVKVK